MESLWAEHERIKSFFRGKVIETNHLQIDGVKYPDSGNVLIFSRCPGNNNRPLRESMFGLEGETVDYDELKHLILKSDSILRSISQQNNYKLSLENSQTDPQFTEKLLQAINILGWKDDYDHTLSYIFDIQKRKPNLVFEVTLKGMLKILSISEKVSKLGYDKKNIHIVLELYTLELLRKENSKSEFLISDAMLDSIHCSTCYTLDMLCNTVVELRNYVDGDIWITFNEERIDTAETEENSSKNACMKQPNMFQIKKTGHAIQFTEDTARKLLEKFREYPEEKNWRRVRKLFQL